MDKKIIIAASIAIGLALMAVLAWAVLSSVEQVKGESMTPEQQRQVALEKARKFVPAGSCTQVITPAQHVSTGAIFTFNTGCLPDGWERYSSLGPTVEE